MDSKKIIVINGSFRKGNTLQLSKLFIDELNKLGTYDIEIVHLKDYPLNYCRSCHQCFLKGDQVCPDYNALSDLRNKLEASDGVMLLSPVYALQITALLKNFLDHNAIYFHRPRFQDKTALAITSTAGNGAKESANYLADVLSYWGFKSVSQLSYSMRGREISEDEKLHKTLTKKAIEFHRIIHQGNNTPSFSQIKNFQLWKRVTYIQGPNAIDYKFWDDKSFYDGRLYFHNNLPFYKKWYASLFSLLFSKVLKEYSDS